MHQLEVIKKSLGITHASATGGELASVEDCTSDAYLRRWLFAREWDVALTQQCIIKHAGWRAHVMPHGYIDEVCNSAAAVDVAAAATFTMPA